jgi:LPS-assembly lipoprotein
MRLLLATLILVLAGCGFHLRGSQALPEGMAKTLIVVPGHSPLYYELESLLLAAGGEVVEKREAASGILRIESAQIRSRTLSLDEQARTSEYGLILTVKYQLESAAGESVGGVLSSRVERDLRVDPDNVMSLGEERSRVEQEMYRIAAQQMVRRLRSAAASAPAAIVPAEEQ